MNQTCQLTDAEKRSLSLAKALVARSEGRWAAEELAKLGEHLRAHPDVLELRAKIFALAERWSDAVQMADALVRIEPARKGELNYSLACYAIASGEAGQAMAFLKAAIDSGGPVYMQRAVEDPRFARILLA
jgi:predicted Zn-dependent protease